MLESNELEKKSITKLNSEILQLSEMQRILLESKVFTVIEKSELSAIYDEMIAMRENHRKFLTIGIPVKPSKLYNKNEKETITSSNKCIYRNCKDSL